MLILIVGLLIFLGAHSVRIFADDWRAQQIAQRGAKTWKGLFTVVSLFGFALIVIGYGAARQQPVVLWMPPVGMAHAASLLTLIAFIFLAAASVPNNAIKAKLGHPMILGVKVWALAHLLSNGMLADVILFGAFLLWAILDFRAARRRQPVATMGIVSTAAGTATAVIAGVVVWALFAFYLHKLLIGVAPMGG